MSTFGRLGHDGRLGSRPYLQALTKRMWEQVGNLLGLDMLPTCSHRSPENPSRRGLPQAEDERQEGCSVRRRRGPQRRETPSGRHTHMESLRLVPGESASTLEPCSRCHATGQRWDRIAGQTFCPDCEESL